MAAKEEKRTGNEMSRTCGVANRHLEIMGRKLYEKELEKLCKESQKT
jgi:hypothetical protein